MDLFAGSAVKAFEGDGGSYSPWSESESPILAEAKVGAGKLLLHPLGFALPHYADSSKVGLVIQGTCGVVGMILPQSTEERVMKLRKGDVVPIPLGAISWWFNDGRDNSDLVIVFMGDTSTSLTPGKFNYFFLAGSQGILTGFSTEVVSRTYDMDTEEVIKLTKSQPGALIVKLEDGAGLKDLAETEPIIGIRPFPGGEISSVDLKGSEVALLGQAALSIRCVRLDAGAVMGPTYTVDSSSQIVCLVRGSGKVEVVGIDGKRRMEGLVKEGEVVVVPKFFTVAAVAGQDGMECFTVTTSPRPILKELAGRASPWKVLSPAALGAALNVSPEFKKNFLSKIDLS